MKRLFSRNFAGSDVNIEMLGKTLIEIFDNRRILIENHRGIQHFGEARIVVRTEKGDVTIVGEKLVVCQMTRNRIVIAGKIQSVSLEYSR